MNLRTLGLLSTSIGILTLGCNGTEVTGMNVGGSSPTTSSSSSTTSVSSSSTSVPTPCTGPACPAITQLVGGYGYECAVLGDATVNCWGGNDSNGRLGNGTTTPQDTPGAVQGLPPAAEAAVGLGHACALLNDTTVRCWGLNSNGQLGSNAMSPSLAPVPVSGLSGVAQIGAALYHSCARLGDTGRVLCWGRGGYLGDGKISSRSTPQEVPGISAATWLAVGGGSTNVTDLAASCAILQDGTARCWGDNTQGQLGDGTKGGGLSPVTVAGLTGAIEITVGATHACAVLNDATARCWGANDNGQLGDGTFAEHLTPMPVLGLPPVAHLSAGERHTCAELLDGTVMCWGENSSGELGRGTPSPMPIPTPALVSGLVGVSALGASSQSTCAYSADRVTRCWGNNQYGQLGIGPDTTSHPAPTAVAF